MTSTRPRTDEAHTEGAVTAKKKIKLIPAVTSLHVAHSKARRAQHFRQQRQIAASRRKSRNDVPPPDEKPSH
jgi:hypothetical protein